MQIGGSKAGRSRAMSKFTLSQGAGQKLEFAVQRNGGTTDDIEYLSTGENFRAVTLLRTGKAKLVEVTEAGTDEAVISTAPTPTAWTVDDEGNIHFTVTSKGLTVEEWKECLEHRRWTISGLARLLLCRVSEAPTNGVTYHIVVSSGKMISDSDRTMDKVRLVAKVKGWTEPHWEVACLIRCAFTDEQLMQMGLRYIVTMHQPVPLDIRPQPFLLYCSTSNQSHGLYVGSEPSDDTLPDDGGGFAFVHSQHPAS